MSIPDVIEKTMSASPLEFHRSIAVLDASRSPSLCHRFKHAGGFVTVEYVALPNVTLGSLLALPQARVTVEFEDIPTAARAEFMAWFDLAFQRGGG